MWAVSSARVSITAAIPIRCSTASPLKSTTAGLTTTLQFRLQKRMSNGLSFQLNYAWSKSLDTGTGNGHGSGIDVYQDAYHPAANYGPSDFNAANTLVGQIVYELPFGRNRQFALHGPLDQIAGGWRLSTLFQWHGGVPFTPVIQGSVAE